MNQSIQYGCVCVCVYWMEIRFWNRYPCTSYRALFCFNNSFRRWGGGVGENYLLALYTNRAARIA